MISGHTGDRISLSLSLSHSKTGVNTMKYKGFLLATAGGLAMAPGAQAADMLVKAPLMPAAPSWTGFYLGGNVGAAWQNMNAANAANSGYFFCGSSCSHIDGSSFTGGGQIGYNWQHGNSVFGLEADISGFSKGPSWHSGFGGNDSVKGISTNANWLSTFRARLGLAVTDTMVYATGGLAVGSVTNKQRFFDDSNTPSELKSETKTKVGWVIGGGVEHMWDAHW